MKVALITGASSGIGLAAAELFLSKGYKVYGVARKPFNGAFPCFQADICDNEKTDAVLREIYEREKRLDVLVNNAGFGIAGAMCDTSYENISRIVNTNLTALCALSGKAVNYMKHTGGKIINVSSVGGIMPLPYQATYSATKAGVEIFSRALANEVRRYNIKVCAVLPGDTKTGFTGARIFEGGDETAVKSVKKMERDELKGASPEKAAKVIYKLAERKNPPPRVAVGFVSKLEIFLSRFLSARTVNRIIRKIYT